MAEFVHLHVHSHYSLLDGGNRISDLIEQTVAHGMRALALTDHGNLYGAIEFYQAARKAGITPILGMEAYIAPRHRTERAGRMREAASHLLLLAMNLRGWHNLIRLSTAAFLDGFYYKPRIDRELLAAHHEGLVCTSACLSGEIPSALLAGRDDAARRIAGEYLDIFGRDRFFIEIQNQGVEDQRRINPGLVALARHLDVGLVGTNDVHFLRRSDKKAHHLLTCISTNHSPDDPDALRHPEELFLKSPEEMAEVFREWPEAAANTMRIAEMCDLKLDFSRKHLPKFETPDGASPDEYLRRLAIEGLSARFGGAEPPPVYQQRLERELSVIAAKGYSSYFLIINDIVQYARQNGIPASPRGSGVATLLGYALGVAHVDPIRYGLLFERFTDPERKEDPDVDIDICQAGRERVLQYVRSKYRHVAQIITYGTLKPRAVIRDLGRVLGWPLSRVDAITKLIPDNPKAQLDKILGIVETDPDEPDQFSADFKRMYTEDADVRHLVDIARSIEGFPRHAGVHAAGVVVCDQPLENLLPLCRQANKPDVMTQWDGPTCEAVGLMKMDLLGLKTLSVIQRARELVRERTGEDHDPARLPLDDEAVYALFRRADTDAVFQFESAGMKRVLLQIQPTRIEDLIAANAMFRPGPMKLIPDYAARKQGREPVPSIHPLVDGLLAETYGIMIYQEQVMQVLNLLGGLPLSRALTLIKAISKKKKDVINAEQPAFVAGAGQHKISPAEAARLFKLIQEFAGYGFNKAHSTGYAIVAYQTAWFKAHYPAEFWAATLAFEADNIEKLGQYMAAAKASGVTILPPDINVSGVTFTVDDEGVRFGLAAVKGVGETAVEAILAARKAAGPFRDLFHFCREADRKAVNRSTVEALIRCGAFDRCGGAHRAQMLAALDAAIAGAQSAATDRARGQLSLFGDEADSPPQWPAVPPWAKAEMLAAERATLGLSLAGHPTDDYRVEVAALRWPPTLSLSHIELTEGRMPARLCAAVAGMEKRTVKHGRTAGRRMAVLRLDDGETGQIEAVLYPETLAACPADLLSDGAMVVAEGTLQNSFQGQVSLAVDHIASVDAGLQRAGAALCLRWSAEQVEDADFHDRLQGALRAHAGRCPVRFCLNARPWGFRHLYIDLKPEGGVTLSHALLADLRGLFDPDAIAIETRAPEPPPTRFRGVNGVSTVRAPS